MAKDSDFNCKNAQYLGSLESRLDRIERKIDKLVAFKFQAIGMAMAISAIVSIGFKAVELIK